MDLAARKRELRQQLSARRRRVSAASASSAGVAVAEAIVATAEFRQAPALALYAALPHELPTHDLFVRAAAASKRCFFPRCRSATVLEFVAIAEWETLEVGHFGVLEPPAGLPAGALPPSSLVVVPGLAFDRLGHRLGYGKGYYDRAFPVGDPRSLHLFGVGFACQLIEQVPTGKLDRAMNAVVTEEGIWRSGGESHGPKGDQGS